MDNYRCYTSKKYVVEKKSEPIISLDNFLFKIEVDYVFEFQNNMKSTYEKLFGKIDINKEIENIITEIGKEKMPMKEFLNTIVPVEEYDTIIEYFSKKLNLNKNDIKNDENTMVDLKEFFENLLNAQYSEKNILQKIISVISNNATLVMRNVLGDLNFNEISANAQKYSEKIKSLLNEKTKEFETEIKLFAIKKIDKPKDFTEKLKK